MLYVMPLGTRPDIGRQTGPKKPWYLCQFGHSMAISSEDSANKVFFLVI